MKLPIRVRLDVPEDERRWHLVLVNVAGAVIAALLPGGRERLGFLAVFFIVSLAGAFQVRVDSVATAKHWRPRIHIVPAAMRDRKVLRWGALFEGLIMAYVVIFALIAADLRGPVVLLWGGLPLVLRMTFIYLAWRIDREEMRRAGLRW